MKLLELKLNNFRQFYGVQCIEFSKDPQNITVILGENGNGKTGIFRAILFCLFNEKELRKDKEDKSSAANKIHLVNLNMLKENVGMPVMATVELIFENKGKKYILERSVYDIIDPEGNIRSGIEIDVKLTIQQHGGNVERILERETEVFKEINDIISDRVKDLFFFDGDKIEALSTTNSVSRKEIKNGIMKLLQIDSVETAIAITEKLKNEQRRKITLNANTKVQAQEAELEEIKVEVLDLNDSLDQQKAELGKVRESIVEFELQQQENEPIKELFMQRKSILESKDKTATILHGIKTNIQDLMSKKGHSLLLEDTLFRARNFIEQEEKEKGFHSGITSDLLEQILSSKECICGNLFCENDVTHLKMLDLKKKYEKMQLSDFIRDFKRNVNSSLESCESTDVNIQELINDYSGQLEEIEKLRKQLDPIDKQINEFSKTEDRLHGIENSLKKCKTDAEALNKRIAVSEHELEKKNKLILEKEADLKVLRDQDKKQERDNNIYKYYENLHDLFTKIADSYSSKMRSRLSTEASDIFKILISEKDKQVISQILINEQYEIQAKGWNEISIFQDISSGQKQMLSLAFVSALARVASGNENSIIDMPLFMDTPFAKLDGNNRDSLISTMPSLTSQWILLVTDTEFARNEVKKMKETDKWDKFYRLDKVKNGYTKIEPVHEINEFVANR